LQSFKKKGGASFCGCTNVDEPQSIYKYDQQISKKIEKKKPMKKKLQKKKVKPRTKQSAQKKKPAKIEQPQIVDQPDQDHEGAIGNLFEVLDANKDNGVAKSELAVIVESKGEKNLASKLLFYFDDDETNQLELNDVRNMCADATLDIILDLTDKLNEARLKSNLLASFIKKKYKRKISELP
jgi:hypothetical protein